MKMFQNIIQVIGRIGFQDPSWNQSWYKSNVIVNSQQSKNLHTTRTIGYDCEECL